VNTHTSLQGISYHQKNISETLTLLRVHIIYIVQTNALKSTDSNSVSILLILLWLILSVLNY